MSTAEADIAPYRPSFTDEEVATFHRDGYLVLPRFAASEMRERMLATTLDHLARDVAPIEYEGELSYPGAPASLSALGGETARRLKAAHSRGIVFTEWLCEPRLINRLRQLLQEPVVVPLAHHNCIMTKQPKFSSDTGWHQDIRYWSFERPELINVWLALGPERRANGCLRVIPGSHLLPLEKSRFDEQMFFRTDLEWNESLLSQAIDVELDAGDILFFHAKTLHAATRNFTDQSKLSVVFTFRPISNAPRPGTRTAAMPEILLG